MANFMFQEEITGWAKLATYVGGAFLSFVGGIITTTWMLRGKIDTVCKDIEEAKTARETDLNLCKLYREQLTISMKMAATEAVDKGFAKWAEELAGARDQRIAQGVTLDHLKESVDKNNKVVGELHRRFDSLLQEKLKGD